MAKKEAPKPLFPLKHEFYAALDNYTQQAGNLAQAVGMLLRNGDLKGPVASVLQERLDAFEASRWAE
jgi:hypothetical protein